MARAWAGVDSEWGGAAMRILIKLKQEIPRRASMMLLELCIPWQICSPRLFRFLKSMLPVMHSNHEEKTLFRFFKPYFDSIFVSKDTIYDLYVITNPISIPSLSRKIPFMIYTCSCWYHDRCYSQFVSFRRTIRCRRRFCFVTSETGFQRASPITLYPFTNGIQCTPALVLMTACTNSNNRGVWAFLLPASRWVEVWMSHASSGFEG